MSSTQQETLVRLGAAIKAVKDQLRGHHGELTGCRYAAVGPFWWIDAFAQHVAARDQIERDLRQLADDSDDQNLEYGLDEDQDDEADEDDEELEDDDSEDDDIEDDLDDDLDDDFDEPDDEEEHEDEEEEVEEEDDDEEDEDAGKRAAANYESRSAEPVSDEADGVAALGLLALLVFGIGLPS